MATKKAAALVTKSSLQTLIDNASPEMRVHIVGKALVGLFDRQTADEKAVNATTKSNSMGFTGSDAKSGSLTARTYLKNKSLQAWQVEKWLKKNEDGFSRITKYHKQLNEIAIRKAAAKQK